MNALAHLVQLPVDSLFRFPGRLLGRVDRVAKQVAGLTNSLRISAVREFDSFAFQKDVEALEQLVLFDRFHSCC